MFKPSCPFVSIVVPAFNEAQLIGRALSSIRDAAQAQAGLGFELIVCDNDSTDETAQIARQHGAQVVHESHRQIARARNTGARAARGKWLLFVDADSEVSEGLLRDTLVAMHNPSVAAGGACVRFKPESLLIKPLMWLGNSYLRCFKMAPGAYLFCQRQIFDAVGGFDEALYATEELDLFKRIKRHLRGGRLRIAISHRNPVVTSARKLKLYGVGENLALLVGMLTRPRQTLRDRARLAQWYDGRR